MTRPTPITTFGLRELELIAGQNIDTANAKSALLGLETYGYAKLGLNKLHRLAQFICQIMHEAGRFRYDRELWGPTPAQKRYDTRTDLGYRGRAGIQITGKANYIYFTNWAKERFANAPDFVKNPDAVNTDPWEGLAAVWYWERNKINAAADLGDVNRVTKIINGGQNGLSDRRRLYVRTALVLLGYGPQNVTQFQMDNDLQVDGVAGPKTFAALHTALALAKPIGTGAVTVPGVVAKPGLTPTTKYGIVGAISSLISVLITYFFGG
jgi:putative chitinase